MQGKEVDTRKKKRERERAEGTSARGSKKDWGRMSILIKVKLSQSLVGIRIESTRDGRRERERESRGEEKKRNKNATRQLKSASRMPIDRGD